MCPLKTFKIKQKKDPWITSELLELIKDKDYALKCAKRTKNSDDWVRARSLNSNQTLRLNALLSTENTKLK